MKVLKITSPDISNGLGCRVTIWFAGCSHKCVGCHNPETWNYNQGTNLNKSSVLDKIYEQVNKPYIKGITLSGGDPLSQSTESLLILLDFIKNFKLNFPDKDIWIWAGDTFEEIKKDELKYSIIKECDVLVDGKFDISKKDRHIAFRGSTNQRIIDLKPTFVLEKIIEMDIQ